MKKILVAYHTKTGTTKEVSESIGTVLTSKGFEVAVKPLAALETAGALDEYHGVVIGAPINGMNWVPEAAAFVTQHQAALNQKPTALFFVSYLIVEGRSNWKNTIRKSLDKPSALVKPVQVGMFGGKIEKTFPTAVRLLFGVRKDAPLDVRNWTDIQTWAEDLAEKLK